MFAGGEWHETPAVVAPRRSPARTHTAASAYLYVPPPKHDRLQGKQVGHYNNFGAANATNKLLLPVSSHSRDNTVSAVSI